MPGGQNTTLKKCDQVLNMLPSFASYILFSCIGGGGRMGLGAPRFFWGSLASPLLNFEFCLNNFMQHN